MNKKKVAALVLSSAMAVSAIAGLCACSGGGGDINYTLDGKVYNAVKANSFKASRADTRADAYVAKKANGTEIGKFKTISAAINAAVNSDVTDEIFEEQKNGTVLGSYVTKVGSEIKLFQNKNGFAENNNDQYWYYEDGNKLGGYDCWSNDLHSILQNTKHVVTQVGSFGRKTMQSWNSYSLRDPDGKEYSTKEMTTATYTLSSTMDAAVMQFVTEDCCITGLDYTYDLSDVKITPPMGDTQTFAFIGCYTWQPYYVIALGLACDTATGNWYPFQGTSRDDSFSQTTYNVGEECVMTSTWHEDGGYFTPDSDTFTMQARTNFLYEFDEFQGKDVAYQVNDYKFECEGAGTYALRVDDAFVANYFGSGAPLAINNVFMAICGLDIISPISDGVKVANTDYFNGSKFEDLRVTNATTYIATAEEISDDKFVNVIPDEEYRGKHFNMMMAADPSTKDKDFGNYTIFNSNAFVNYKADNGQDVYSFKYDGSPVSDKLYSAEVSRYQDEIDALAAMTVETAFDYDEEMEEIAGWYEKTDTSLPQRIGSVLDYSEYLRAKEKVIQAATLSDEGKAAVAEFNKLSTILPLYDYKGWTKPAGEESMAGYLYTELETFRNFKAIYNSIESDLEKNATVFRHISKAQYEEWKSLDDAITALEENTKFMDLKLQLPELATSNNAATEVKTRTGMNAIEDVIRLAYAIGAGKRTSSDDANTSNHTFMNSDNHWTSSWHILFITLELKEKGFNIFEDGYFANMLDKISDANTENLITDVTYLYNVLKLAKYIQDNQLVAIDEKVAEIANKYMVGKVDFAEGGLKWNYNGNGFAGRNAKFVTYFGFPERTDWMFYIRIVTDLLEDKGATLTVSTKGGSLGITAEVQAAPSDLSTAAQAVVTQIRAISALNENYLVVGWEAADGAEDIRGYYYSEILAIRAAKTAFNALSETDKAAVLANINEASWNAWLAEEAVIDAITQNAKWETKEFKVPNVKNTATKVEGDKTVIDWDNPTFEEDDGLLQPTYIVGEKVPDTMCSMQDAKWALTQMLISASTISATGKGCNWYGNSNTNHAPRIALCKEYLESINVTLTPYLTKVLEDTLFNDWYEQIWTPITGIIDLVEDIRAHNHESLADLSEEQIAFLNANYTTSFEKGSVFDVIWNGNSLPGDTGTGLKDKGTWAFKIALLIRVYVTAEGYTYVEGQAAFEGYQTELNAFLESNGFTIADDKWGVTVASLEEPDGFVEDKAGTLLPDKTAKWTINAGVDASLAEHMAVSAKTDSYQFTASKTDDWASVSVALTGKSFNVAKNAIYYDLKVSNGGKCDIVLYAKNGDGKVYGYLGEQFETPVKNNITGEVKGHVSLQKLHDWYVANKQLPSAETLEFVFVRVYVCDGTTVNIKSLYVDELPVDELYGNAGTSLTKDLTASDWHDAWQADDQGKIAMGHDTSTLTVENNTSKVQTTGGHEYSYYMLPNITIKRDTIIYYDLTIEKGESASAAADMVVWLGPQNHYFNLGGVIAGAKSGENALNGNMKGIITGLDILEYLVTRGRSAWGYTTVSIATMEEITIYQICFYLNSSTLTINDLRVVGEFTDNTVNQP